ncbi:hypothetical protein SCHPADRAFT_808115, partial [Schizopora paradoxa]
PQEPSSDIWRERSELSGTVVASVVYGIHICVIMLIFRVSKDNLSTKIKRLMTCGVFLLFAFATIELACQARILEIMWIDQRDIPGGPIVWLGLEYTLTAGILGLSTFVVANFIADSFLIFRLYVIWGNNRYIIILPVLSNIAAAILTGFAVAQSVHPNSNFSLGSRNTVVPYFILTILLNIVLSFAIMVRLLQVRHSVKTIVGPEHANTYTSLSAMIVESSALTSVVGAVTLACYIQNNPALHFSLILYDQVVCLAPQLIALRVALGRAWTSDTSRGELSG